MISTEQTPSELPSLYHGCPVCGGHDKQLILDHPNVPLLCNVLEKTRDKALQVERGRLYLLFCPICGMIYNASFDPHRVTYTGNYENAQHFSPRFCQYLGNLATRLVTDYNIFEQNIIEIGCGDARFLTLLCKAGRNRGVGYDPAAPEKLTVDAETDITIVRELYSEVTATTPPDFICCRHVLEHIFDPISFLTSVRRTLRDRPDSYVYFEVPNVLAALRDLAVWEFLYEHGQYFSESSLSTLFTSCGFDVLEICETFSGQFLSLVAKPTAEKPKRWETNNYQLQCADPFVSLFESHYTRTVQLWHDTLKHFFDQRKKVAIWGAGTKGVMFLNSVPGGEHVHFAVDVNPRKHGCYIAGTGQEIVSPGQLQKLQPDVLLVMNPIYENEIRAELNLAGSHAQVIVV